MKVKGSSILQNPSTHCNFSNTIMAARLESPLPLWLYQYPTNLNGLLLRRGMLFTRRRAHTVCARSTHTHTRSQRLLCDTEQVAESTQFCRGAKAIFLSRFFFFFLLLSSSSFFLQLRSSWSNELRYYPATVSAPEAGVDANVRQRDCFLFQSVHGFVTTCIIYRSSCINTPLSFIQLLLAIHLSILLPPLPLSAIFRPDPALHPSIYIH